jgi:hypothetical protein
MISAVVVAGDLSQFAEQDQDQEDNDHESEPAAVSWGFESRPPHLNGRSLRHFHAQPAQAGRPYVGRLQQPRPRMILEYLGIADR